MAQPDASMTIEVPFNLDAWRILAGAERCENCGTEVAVANIEDDEGRPTGERGLFEIVEQPEFGTPHTPERCRSART